MRKATIAIAAIFLAAVLCSCQGKPKNTSDTMYQIGVNALSVADEYIDGKISGAEASERLEEYNLQAGAQYEKECKDADADSLVGTDYSNDFAIQFDVFMLHFVIDDVAAGTKSMQEFKENRDTLSKDIGK